MVAETATVAGLVGRVTDLSLLAHAGAGATWQALVTAIALGVVGVFLIAATGRVKLQSKDDLVLALAAIGILAGLAPTASNLLSDWVGQAAAAGSVVLVTLSIAARPGRSLHWRSPLAIGTVVVAVAAAVWLGPPLNVAWHPRDPTLPLADDASVSIMSPEEGATVETEEVVTVTVAVAGATVVATALSTDSVPADPEDRGRLRVFLDGREVAVQPLEECTDTSPCERLTYELLELERGPHTLIVEFVRADGVPLAPSVSDRVTFERR